MDKNAPEGQDDLFPPLGNLSDSSLKHMREVIDKGDPIMLESYEALTEDFIQTYSHAVIQGVPADWALFCMAQAFAITLGQCIRAGFKAAEGGRLLAMIVKNAELSERMVKQVSIQ